MNKKKKWKWLHELIYDLIFSIHGAVNADFVTGWRLADKYALWVQKRQTIKSEKELSRRV